MKSRQSRLWRSLLVARRTILNEMRSIENVVRAVLREAGWCEGRPIAMIPALASVNTSLTGIVDTALIGAGGPMQSPKSPRVRIAPGLELSPITVVLIGWMAVTALLAYFLFA